MTHWNKQTIKQNFNDGELESIIIVQGGQDTYITRLYIERKLIDTCNIIKPKKWIWIVEMTAKMSLGLAMII